MVLPLQILAYIADAIDVVALLGEIPTYWMADPRVPQYVIKLEEAQRKADGAALPISDDWLAAFATSSLLRANSYLTNRPA